jgi:magnesium transporter
MTKNRGEHRLYSHRIVQRYKEDNVLRLPFWQSVRHRFPWLLLGLFGGVMAAGIVGSFEETISQHLVLAAFIPLIVYMADAVGTQMEAFIIRDLAMHPRLPFRRYVLRQLSIIVLIGVLTSTLLYTGSLLVYRQAMVSLVLGVSLFAAIISSVLTGLIIPYAFGRFRMDPANASGPIATIIQDLLSVFIYFLVASTLL